jgi:hypothetical protein
VFERLKIEFPLTKAGKGNNLYSYGPLSPYPAYSYHAGLPPLEQQEMLQTHNRERQKYPGVGPLQWSPELARYAQEEAQRLAEMGYDPRVGGNPYRDSSNDNPLRPGEPLGENIFFGLGHVATGADAVESWIREKQSYNYDRDDAITGYGAYAEFRQVIWKATQFVGCGKAYRTSGDGTTYIVCNYYPAGNWVGQKPY